MGEKAQYTQKGQKTLKTGIFHSHPCGFYIKNRPFAIELAVWGLGLLLFQDLEPHTRRPAAQACQALLNNFLIRFHSCVCGKVRVGAPGEYSG